MSFDCHTHPHQGSAKAESIHNCRAPACSDNVFCIRLFSCKSLRTSIKLITYLKPWECHHHFASRCSGTRIVYHPLFYTPYIIPAFPVISGLYLVPFSTHSKVLTCCLWLCVYGVEVQSFGSSPFSIPVLVGLLGQFTRSPFCILHSNLCAACG